MRLPMYFTRRGYNFLSWTGRGFHPGVDYNRGKYGYSDLGDPVFPTMNGQVVFVQKALTGYGNMVIIRHRDKTYSKYAHLDEIDVKEKEWITTSTQLGTVGNTGASTSPHLHFEWFDKHIYTLGENFYPVHRETKSWVKQHYFDPDTIKPVRLNVLLLLNDMNWLSIDKKIKAIQEEVDNKLFSQVDLQFTLQYTDFASSKMKWAKNGDKKDQFVLHNKWVRDNVLPNASGYDIACLVLSHDDWGKNGLAGYASSMDDKYGIQFIAMKAKEKGKRRGGDEFIGRFIHELCHTLVQMHYQKTPDTVHQHDYQKVSKWEESLKKIDFDHLRKWEIKDTYRMFKRKKDGRVLTRLVKFKQARMYKIGIKYWELFGFRNYIEQPYEKSLE